MRSALGSWARGSAALAATIAASVGIVSCGSVLGSDAFLVGECSEGARQCSNNTQQKCASGRWVAEDPCDHKTCDPSAGMCAGECAPQGRRCAGDIPQTCDAKGSWESAPAPCEAGTHCSGGLCLVACVPGDLRCIGNTPQTCVDNGQWLDQPSGACVNQTCLSGVCTGECALKDAQCKGNIPQSCDVNGEWKDQAACATSCVAGSCPGPSCEGLPETCGPAGNESCCLSPVVVGGTFNRDNNANYPAVLSDFRLDRFEVTVGRFRAFVDAYPNSKPSSGAGAHPLLPKSGWHPSWDPELPADKAAFMTKLSCSANPTWSDIPQNLENWPILCVSWYEAFAFCAWDGGRLPTSAEWNYAAAGGSEQRLYPWSNPPSSATVDDTYAVYFGIPPVNVGGKSPKGDGKWGQADLSGNAWEWALDYYVNAYEEDLCVDCAALSPSGEPQRVLRGGNWYFAAQEMYTSTRAYGYPQDYNEFYGFRCARTP